MTLPLLSIGLPPGPNNVEVAKVAEEFGCARVWLFDSAALYEDLWIWLDRIARETTIGLGTAVLVPNLRHVMTTASAIATIEHVAPGRLVCGLGTGATARWVLGRRALSWAATRRYVETLRGLLAGEVVEVDGARTQMIHWPGLAPARPISTPLLLSAFGPKGLAITAEVADGLIDATDTPWRGGLHVRMFNGTVVLDGEDPNGARAREAVAPWLVMGYHGAYTFDPAVVDHLPGGAAWRAAIEAARPEGERHLAVHEGHVSHLTERDRALLLDAAWESRSAGILWMGSPAEIRERAAHSAANGVTELLYTPTGPDVVGEVRRMAEALAG
ncbi:MAG: LLM class flavin-dependent oxidoreductase [Actinomycetes bacterium]